MGIALDIVYIIVTTIVIVWGIGTITVGIGILCDAIHLLRADGEYSARDKELLELGKQGTWPLVKDTLTSAMSWPLALFRKEDND